MLRREHMPHMLGIATLAIVFSATTVHPQPAPANTAGQTTAGAPKTPTISKSDANYLREMAQVNMAEVEAGKLAQSKTKNPEVRDFATKMVDDHSKGLTQVQQVAQAKGVTLPTEPNKKQMDEIKKLNAMSGEQFDKQYMAHGGVVDHRQADKMLQKAETKAKDPDVKNLAKNMKGTVDQHLKMAEQVNSDVKKGAATGSSGTGGTSGGGPK